MLIAGVTDMERKFHSVCLDVLKNEKKRDFNFIFESIKSGVDDE